MNAALTCTIENKTKSFTVTTRQKIWAFTNADMTFESEMSKYWIDHEFKVVRDHFTRNTRMLH